MTDTTTTAAAAPTRDPDHDMHAAEIYRAIALRFHARYMGPGAVRRTGAATCPMQSRC